MPTRSNQIALLFGFLKLFMLGISLLLSLSGVYFLLAREVYGLALLVISLPLWWLTVFLFLVGNGVSYLARLKGKYYARKILPVLEAHREELDLATLRRLTGLGLEALTAGLDYLVTTHQVHEQLSLDRENYTYQLNREDVRSINEQLRS